MSWAATTPGAVGSGGERRCRGDGDGAGPGVEVARVDSGGVATSRRKKPPPTMAADDKTGDTGGDGGLALLLVLLPRDDDGGVLGAADRWWCGTMGNMATSGKATAARIESAPHRPTVMASGPGRQRDDDVGDLGDTARHNPPRRRTASK